MFHGQRRSAQTGWQSTARAVAAGLLLSACVGTIDTPRTWSEDPHDPESPGTALPVGATGVSPNNTAVPGAPGSNGATAPGAPGKTSAGGSAPGTCAVGSAPMRRLTHAEYNNAVRDLLGDVSAPASNFVLDNQVGIFNNSSSAQTVPSVLSDQYIDTALDLAESVTDVKKLVGCDPKGTTASAGATCVRNFVSAFGRRAYRRPLSTQENTRLLDLYNATRTASDEATGVRAVVSAVLVSPNFLFRPEFGATAGLGSAKKLTGYEQAARLASFLWASIPDDALLDAAANNQLSTPAQIEAQARRMLVDPKAKSAVADFFDQWLGLSVLTSAVKDPAFYPGFDDELRDSMIEERRRFISYVIWEGDAKLETLLTASFSFVNAPLAKLYGASGGPTDSTTFQKVALDPRQRAGVMTQAAMLAAFASPDESSPVKRGKWVRERMLCTDLPAPPAVIPQLPEPKQGVSNRERFAMHTNNPACAGCHKLVDGLGFGLENYDAVGAWRTMDQGVPVNASGDVTSTVDIDGPFTGGAELANTLASSAQVRDCAPTQAVRFAWGRRETPDDACSVAAVQKAFADSDGNLKELMVKLTLTDTFTNYRVAD